MARTRVRWGRLGAVLASATVAVALAAGGAGAAQRDAVHGADRSHAAKVRTYVVRTGDTLWGIAARLAGPREDPRPVVDLLTDSNRLAGGLQAGQTIVLPASV